MLVSDELEQADTCQSLTAVFFQECIHVVFDIFESVEVDVLDAIIRQIFIEVRLVMIPFVDLKMGCIKTAQMRSGQLHFCFRAHATYNTRDVPCVAILSCST